jgi:hypothetical protein
LLWGACSEEVSKDFKIKFGQVALPKTSLVTLGIFNPLGVKVAIAKEWLFTRPVV